MSKINKLPATLIPKIAAGEVIERPASVVKELVENAIDAKATNIVVEVEDGGLTRIRVIDNGEGMDQKDILQCFLPHTTSKIGTLEDLQNVRSMGFRGEALSSIASVSKITIKSVESSADLGNEIHIVGGELEFVKPAGMSFGTVVAVADLFFNTPARKKFLKNAALEFRYILKLVSGYVLSQGNVGIELYHNGKNIIKVLPDYDFEKRVRVIFGEAAISEFIPINYADKSFTLHGYISKPQRNSPNSDEQYLFVNGRTLTHLGISKSIKRAYGTLLDPRVYPQYIIKLVLDPSLVDVNIHPRKEQLNFWNEKYVTSSVEKLVTEALGSVDLTYTYGFTDADKSASSTMFNALKSFAHGLSLRDKPDTNYIDMCFQVADTYLAYPADNGIVLVDQHAAHESIIYHQLVDYLESGSPNLEFVQLTPALVLEFPVTIFTHLSDNLDYLNKLGFEIELFMGNSLKVGGIPELFKDHDLKILLTDIVMDLETGGGSRLDSISDRTLKYLACRSAVKAGDALNKEEQLNLIKQLDDSQILYTCPHGRPVRIILSVGELEKLFKRRK